MSQRPPTASLTATLRRVAQRFAGRSSLSITEVAAFFVVVDKHVMDLAEEYVATRGESGLEAVDTTVRPKTAWRITVAALERFLKERWAA
jgi:hypothetical protein